MAQIIDTKEGFDKAYKGSYYTITGASNVKEYEDGYAQLLRDAGIDQPEAWYTFTGKAMNAQYQLIGEVAYPDDLTFLAFPLTGIASHGRLAMFKLQNGDRWFDDIVDNNDISMGRQPIRGDGDDSQFDEEENTDSDILTARA